MSHDNTPTTPAGLLTPTSFDSSAEFDWEMCPVSLCDYINGRRDDPANEEYKYYEHKKQLFECFSTRLDYYQHDEKILFVRWFFSFIPLYQNLIDSFVLHLKYIKEKERTELIEAMLKGVDDMLLLYDPSSFFNFLDEFTYIKIPKDLAYLIHDFSFNAKTLVKQRERFYYVIIFSMPDSHCNLFESLFLANNPTIDLIEKHPLFEEFKQTDPVKFREIALASFLGLAFDYNENNIIFTKNKKIVSPIPVIFGLMCDRRLINEPTNFSVQQRLKLSANLISYIHVNPKLSSKQLIVLLNFLLTDIDINEPIQWGSDRITYFIQYVMYAFNYLPIIFDGFIVNYPYVIDFNMLDSDGDSAIVWLLEGIVSCICPPTNQVLTVNDEENFFNYLKILLQKGIPFVVWGKRLKSSPYYLLKGKNLPKGLPIEFIKKLWRYVVLVFKQDSMYPQSNSAPLLLWLILEIPQKYFADFALELEPIKSQFDLQCSLTDYQSIVRSKVPEDTHLEEITLLEVASLLKHELAIQWLSNT